MPFRGSKPDKKEKKTVEVMVPAWFRRTVKVFLAVLLSLIILVVIFARVIPEQAVLRIPENSIARILVPVQSIFSGLVDSVVIYLRSLKTRANLEIEYNRICAENNDLRYQTMLIDELENRLNIYAKLDNEMSVNESMRYIKATIIGKDEGNYTSTFSINKGKRDGIEDMMAVTFGGALVGYTIETKDTSARVKTIIDTDASVPALIQTTRDEGNIRGTLGIDGTQMCRMYHTDEYIPRTGDKVVTSGKTLPFPKGIPIGSIIESTRGMESNKQYIVVKPFVDFSHLEYVLVIRYQPLPDMEEYVPDNLTGIDYYPLDTPRPMPTIQVNTSSIHAGVTPTPDALVTALPVNTTAPAPTPTPKQNVTTRPPQPEFTYNDPNVITVPTFEPVVTKTPQPTKTISVDDLTVEDDN